MVGEEDELLWLLPYNVSGNGDDNRTEFEVVCNFVTLNSTESVRNLVADPNCFRHSTPWTIFFCVVYCFIFTCGLMGNGLVIWVITWKPRMRTVTNMFILNLAVADLFVIVVCLPATLLSNIFIPWVLGDLMCRAVAYVQGVSVFSSVWSLVAVSGDRCWAIYRPMGLPRGLSKAQSFFFITLIWCCALLITLPWWNVFQISYWPETGPLPYCHESWAKPVYGQLYFVLVHLLICYCLPLVLIIILNGIIWRSVSSRQIPHNPSSSSMSAPSVHNMHRATKLRVLRMLASLTFAFFICWLPLYAVMTRLKFFGPPVTPLGLEMMHIIIPLAQVLGSCNSCVNPILYAFLNKKFRDTLTTLLSSCCCSWCCNFSSNPASGLSSWTMRTNPGTNQQLQLHSLNNFGIAGGRQRRRPCTPSSSSRIGSQCHSRLSREQEPKQRRRHNRQQFCQSISFHSTNVGQVGSTTQSECMCTHF